jgi:Spy/CpxP family protein refolding chaperone
MLLNSAKACNILRQISRSRAMRNRLAILGLLAAALWSAAAVAESQGPSCHDASIRTALAQVGLSDTQKQSIRQIMDGHQKAMDGFHESERQQHQAFLQLDPTASDYAAQVGDLAEQAAALAAQRVQEFAVIKSQVHAVLTPAQRSQLGTLLGNMKPQEMPPAAPASN